MAEAAATFNEWYVKSSYQEFMKREGVPVYEGSGLENLQGLPLGEWERRGGKAAYTRLGEQEERCLQIIEIPPKGQLKPERHMYDAVMYVMRGRGATTIWQEGEPKQTVEWEEGSLLAIPMNAWHQEFNASSDGPTRFFFCTNMPYIINLYQNLEFVFNNSFQFKDRYSHAMQNFFSDEGKHWTTKMFATNFIPDIRKFRTLDPCPERGDRHTVIRLSMAATSLGIHIAEVGEGTYMTAHRHGPGAHVVAIEGDGYELLFMPGEERRRKIPLKPYAVISPRQSEFHQHFNTSKGVFRMLAFRGNGVRYGWGAGFTVVAPSSQSKDPNEMGFNITYEMEDPAIRAEYYRELEKRGITSRLRPIEQRGGA